MLEKIVKRIKDFIHAYRHRAVFSILEIQILTANRP